MKKIIVLLLLSCSCMAQVNVKKVKHALLDKGTALAGYDAVSYFSGKPSLGKAQFKTNVEGINYLFANATNQEAFTKNPTKYEPTCGGWCAYAMAKKNKKVEVDPKNFKIVDGKLNLFYKDFFGNTLDDWNEDEVNLKKLAQINWTKTLEQ